MKEFALLFRFPNLDHSKMPPEDYKALAKKWQDWAGGIAAQGKMSSNGLRLALEGKVLNSWCLLTLDGHSHIAIVFMKVVLLRTFRQNPGTM